MKMGDVEELIRLLLNLLFLILYPIIIIYIAILLNLGLYSWIVIGLFLIPPVAAWLIILRKRAESYLATLMEKEPPKWNVEEKVEEYIELLEKERKRSKEVINQA